MKRSLFLAASGALAASTATAQTIISENFESGMADLDFTVVDDGDIDGTQDFAFDYVSAGIPLAPRSEMSDVLGLRLTVNDTLGAVDSITCFHNTVVSAPSYRLTVDAFMNYGAGSGTTEYAHIGVASDGATYNEIFDSGEGAFFSFTGDGGSSSSDYRVHRAAAITRAGADSGTLGVTDPAHLGRGCNNADAFFQDLFPATNGAPSNIWTTVTIEVDAVSDLITFYMDGTLVYRAETTGSLDGQVSLCLADFFSSLSTANNFALYDNLTVEVFQPGLCSQSNDSVTVEGGLVACAGPGPAFEITENQWLRRYSTSGDCGVTGDFTLTGVNWAAGVAMTPTGVQPIQIRAYTIAPGDPFLYANMTMLADELVMLPDTSNTLQSTTFTTPVVVPAGQDLVLEIAKTTPLMMGVYFRPGGNTFGETGDTFLASSACGIDDPVNLATIGFPGAAIILDPVCGIGQVVCSPALANSTGTPARICAIGSDVASSNDLTLSVVNLPMNSNGFFFTSQELNYLPVPDSLGRICIASFSVGRYDSSILNSGMGGAVSLALDLTAIPQIPGGPVAAMAGDTRYWQFWYRDTDPAGGSTSNYSDAICVTFQ